MRHDIVYLVAAQLLRGQVVLTNFTMFPTALKLTKHMPCCGGELRTVRIRESDRTHILQPLLPRDSLRPMQ